jgi:hypothetical protein
MFFFVEKKEKCFEMNKRAKQLDTLKRQKRTHYERIFENVHLDCAGPESVKNFFDDPVLVCWLILA